MDDDDWDRLASLAKLVVPTGRKPSYARRDTDWQVIELLRGLASGRYTVSLRSRTNVPGTSNATD